MDFKLHSPYKPAGDQPQAIEKLNAGINAGKKFQTLMGVTGSGKTFTMASIIARLNRPTLVISHNKTLAAQLYQEFKEFFPENAVHYFVSYYDYYQPEAYLPATDTYIEKDAKINDFIDRLRHASTESALTRRDFIIVASVSCIYGIGDPEEYAKIALELKIGRVFKRGDFLKRMADMQYARNDIDKIHGTFSVKGDAVEIVSPDGETIIRVDFFGDKIESLSERKNSPLSNSRELDNRKIFPAKHFITEKEKLGVAIKNIKIELDERLEELGKAGKILEAERLRQRVNFDMEMLEQTGYVSGIENYSRQLSFRKAGLPPQTLLDYLPKDALIFIDESHMSMPQIRGMFEGDKARKRVLVDYGFRLPSALDNRPLKFNEFEEKIGQTVFISATPADFEIKKSGGEIVEQLIRPTGLLEPKIEIRPASASAFAKASADKKATAGKPAKGQIKDAEEEIAKAAKNNERVLLVTLTKRLAEEIADYLREKNIKVEYLHSEIKTIERSKTLQNLRKGDFDVLVGINLLREGLDLPEVGLVAILDADKEGFLRNFTSLTQTIGRAARHPNGRAILYADTLTLSIERTIKETERRRKIQEDYNRIHKITPQAIKKEIRPPFWLEEKSQKDELAETLKQLQKEFRDPARVKAELERQMLEAASELRFEEAAKLRDLLKII
ncbi:MAG: excinuclease ABC subunit UvrB [Candidatus Niyogibacteria bacterium]|nr:MAG: excinuclease ABC subunit UvrB [Candidatus Niyogibacteria bacterium]